MARKRMIDPEFWLDEDIAELQPYARLLYIGLWGICDDNYATLPNKPRWVKAQVFPYNDGVDVEHYLDDLIKIGKLTKFTENGEEYLHIKNFFKYQRVDRPSTPKYPEYKGKKGTLDEPSTSPRPEVKLSKVKLSKDNTVHFEKIWERYPNRIGKKQAFTHYKSSVKNQEDVLKINHALDNYLTSSAVKKGYIQHGSTWFNNWQDWVDFKEAKIVKPSKKDNEVFDKDASRAELAKLKEKIIKTF